MERTKRSPKATSNVKKKMTREQIQEAIIKKKECDARALKIVEQLLEPEVDPSWLVEKLQHINRCHMEDVIEERAITRICGYVLCQKPLTVVYKQQYHISLKDKQVYDVSKRKNFCSSSCFGASNYLLEQLLTSPLWMRDKEEIPTFKIFKKDVLGKNNHHGATLNLNEGCSIKEENEKKDQSAEKNSVQEENEFDLSETQETEGREVLGSIEDFVLKTIKKVSRDTLRGSSQNVPNINESIDIKENEIPVETVCKDKSVLDESTSEMVQNSAEKNVIKCYDDAKKDGEILQQVVYTESTAEKNQDASIKQDDDDDDDDIIEQYNYFTDESTSKILSESFSESSIAVKEKEIKKNYVDCSRNKMNASIVEDLKCIEKDESPKSVPAVHAESQKKEKIEKKKSRVDKKKKREVVVENLTAGIEKSFQEWVTEETISFLFGDDSVKQKAIEKVAHRDRYSLLCEKLDRLQFEDEQEDALILEKQVLKPAPHFDVLREEGKKLEIKVRAFYQGKTTFEELKNPEAEEDDPDTDTVLPLTEAHAPQALRRKIFLEKLDHVLPDLLRTLAGNNEVHTKACLNYTSVRCTAVKALVQTFSLSANNIILKTAEWTLAGLVIIKMLSLLDPWLANLLLTKQANMYISMIMASYSLDANYLNLFVASFNPNMNY